MTAAPTLADFAAWLSIAQAHALNGMGATEGDAFTAHLDAFTQASTAINVLLQFNSAQPTNTSTSNSESAA